MRHQTLILLAAAGVIAASAMADTLVLRSGRRIEGELIEVRGTTVEFEESGGRTLRYKRSEVARIELASSRYDDGERSSGQRPRGLREKYVSVAAGTQWTDTGVDVRSGAEVYFEATGKVRWGKDRQDGPAGEGGSRYNPTRPIPGRPGGALIGRIGDSDPFFIGDEKGPFEVPASGRLHLGVNDDYLLDNQGSFRVTIYY